MAEILNMQGELTEGVMGLYYLVNGVILFSETVKWQEGEGLYFESKETMVIGMQQQGKQVNISAQRLSENPFKPGSLWVPESALMMTVRTKDADFVAKMRAALSGLVIPGMGTGGMVN